MCGRADVVAAPVQRAKHIGPGHGRNAVMVDIGAREQCAFGVDDRRIARAQGEAIGTGHALGIKQGMHDDGIAGERRLLDPDGAERRRLLAAWVGRADRQAACHDTEVLMIGACAKETRPLEDRNLRHPAVNRAQDAETREAQVTYIGRNRDFSEIEKICRIGEPSLEAVLDEVDLDLCRKNGAAMQGLDDETGVCVFPDVIIGLALDADIEIVGQACSGPCRDASRGPAPYRDCARNRSSGLAARAGSPGLVMVWVIARVPSSIRPRLRQRSRRRVSADPYACTYWGFRLR